MEGRVVTVIASITTFPVPQRGNYENRIFGPKMKLRRKYEDIADGSAHLLRAAYLCKTLGKRCYVAAARRRNSRLRRLNWCGVVSQGQILEPREAISALRFVRDRRDIDPVAPETVHDVLSRGPVADPGVFSVNGPQYAKRT